MPTHQDKKVTIKDCDTMIKHYHALLPDNPVLYNRLIDEWLETRYELKEELDRLSCPA